MNVKDKKGSITIFVLVGLLFMSAFLIISYASNVNKSKIAKEQFNIISDIYSYKDGDANAYNRAYTALRKKNKQLLTASTEGQEDTSLLELTKTFEDKASNYRIYGNTEGVGDQINLFDINSVTKFYYTDESSVPADRESILNGLITNTYGTYGRYIFCNSNVTNLETGTYILSADALVSEGTQTTTKLVLGMRTVSGINYGCSTVNHITLDSYDVWERVSLKIELLENTEIFGFLFQGIGSSANYKELSIKFKNIQLEKNDIATEYTSYGTYRIPIKLTNEKSEISTTNIYISNPLKDGEYIDFKLGKVVRADGTEESIELPEISTLEDYTKIEVLTEVKPSKIEIEYVGYTFK